jgi:hypothetical protein
MFEWRDLFQWERFITPAIIKIFYALAVVLVGLLTLLGVTAGFGAITVSPVSALITVAGSVVAGVAGVFFARIATEFVLIVFRIDEHIAAIRGIREIARGQDSELPFPPDDYGHYGGG